MDKSQLSPLKLFTHSIFFKEFGVVFHNLAALTLNVRVRMTPSVSRFIKARAD